MNASELSEQANMLSKTISDLRYMQNALAQDQVSPTEQVYRDPKDVYHEITLGKVLGNHDFSAHDARRLDGLLSSKISTLATITRDERADIDEDVTVASYLVKILDVHADRFDAQGAFAEWRRKYDRYIARVDSFLASRAADELDALLSRSVSKAQRHMVRYTVNCLRVEFPALANRREAYEWLRDVGANPRYRKALP